MCSNPRQTALTRSRFDDVHQADDMRISTYAGQYAFTPLRNCPDTYPIQPTVRIQQSGASYVTGMWKTEVESDLKGVGRPPSRWRTDTLLYDPRTNAVNQAGVTNLPEENTAPTNFNRLVNPPCTLRTTGWNRWQPLFHNPQATFETPFDWYIPARSLDKFKCRKHPLPPTNYTEEVVARVAQ